MVCWLPHTSTLSLSLPLFLYIFFVPFQAIFVRHLNRVKRNKFIDLEIKHGWGSLPFCVCVHACVVVHSALRLLFLFLIFHFFGYFIHFIDSVFFFWYWCISFVHIGRILFWWHFLRVFCLFERVSFISHRCVNLYDIFEWIIFLNGNSFFVSPHFK